METAFFLDDVVQLTRRRPPFTAELRLSEFPTEQTIRAEGYDENGEVVLVVPEQQVPDGGRLY